MFPEVKPHQVTIVPDAEGKLTSEHCWDTLKNKNFFIEIISVFKNAGIRTSIFCDPVIEMVEGALTTGTDRIELYTEAYVNNLQLVKNKKQENRTWLQLSMQKKLA